MRNRSFERLTGDPLGLADRAVRPLRHVHRSRVDAFAPEAAELRAALGRKQRYKSVAAASARRDAIHAFLHDHRIQERHCRSPSLCGRYEGARTLPIGALAPEIVEAAIQRETAPMSSAFSR